MTITYCNIFYGLVYLLKAHSHERQYFHKFANVFLIKWPLKNIYNVPEVYSGMLIIVPRALHIQHFLGGGQTPLRGFPQHSLSILDPPLGIMSKTMANSKVVKNIYKLNHSTRAQSNQTHVTCNNSYDSPEYLQFYHQYWNYLIIHSDRACIPYIEKPGR